MAPTGACDGVFVGEDADDGGPALDLAVEALQRIGGMQLRPLLSGEAHVGQHVWLRVVDECGKPGQLRL
jgi:hypothetical protein